MFTLIVGFKNPLTETREDKSKFFKALATAVVIDFLLIYTAVKYCI